MRAMLAMLVNYIPLSEIIEYRIFTDNCAEGKGFEPLVRDRRTTVFKTVTFGRSVNLPLFDRHVDSSAYLPNAHRERILLPIDDVGHATIGECQ